MSRGIVDPRLQALPLLVLADVQEELQNRDAVLGQDPLERVDLLVPLRPDRPGHELVNAHDEDVLVVGAVEDADLAALRDPLVNPPEEVVPGLLDRRFLEGGHAASLGVQSGHDVGDRSVLARRVHRLEDDQNGSPAFGVETELQLSQALEVLEERLLGPLLVADIRGVRGISSVECGLLPRFDPEPVAKVLRHNLSSSTGPSPASRR